MRPIGKRAKPDKVWFDKQFAALGISQNEAARRMGIDSAVLSRMLCGKQRLTVPVLGKLCELFAPLGKDASAPSFIAAFAGYPELICA
jgi:transcriptional regulator with XRE-family HTH domain